MAGTTNPASVSAFQPIGKETMKQSDSISDRPVNNPETLPLKTLALRVLQRNIPGNASETPISNVFAPNVATETGQTKAEFQEWWEERAAIFEYEGGYLRAEAEQLADESLRMEFGEQSLAEYLLPQHMKKRTAIH